MIDVDLIVNDTLKAFESSKNKLANLPSISQEQYSKIHSYPLVPLMLKIDTALFQEEIKKYDFAFERWGKKHNHLPRFGAALVNSSGIIHKGDPINGSLTEWNLDYPNTPLIETDCISPTDILNIHSLDPLRVFDGYWCRSNILKWYSGAKFLPHVDTVIPSPWIRLWGTTSSDNFSLKFYFNNGEIIEPKIEAGRIYIIDTSIVHDAECTNGTNYQFFLSVLPGAINILEKEIANG